MRQTLVLAICLYSLMAGCSPDSTSPVSPAASPQPLYASHPAVSAQPTPSAVPATRTLPATRTPEPTPTPLPAQWTQLAPGVQQRYVPVNRDSDPAVTYYIYALRLDPAQLTFRVQYDREMPRNIDSWLTDTGAEVVVNGGFFSGDYRPVGRLVSDGQMAGFPLNYGDRTIGVAGLFTVLDGRVQLYSLGRGSFSPRAMRFDEAIESYPMLLLPGRQPAYPIETGERARRTVIGVDSEQHVIILVVDLPIFSLHELANWLAASDLRLDAALNLDGGRSSGLGVALGDESVIIPAYVSLPAVLAIYTEDGS